MVFIDGLQLSLQLFKEFAVLYGYVSPIEYTKDSIFRDQNFVLIQQTLRFYDELLAEILDRLFPSAEIRQHIQSLHIALKAVDWL